MHERPPVTPLARALRGITQKRRMSSLDVPVVDDAADHIDDLDAINAELLAALKLAAAAINPPERNGISLHDWDSGLKAATVAIRAAIARAESKE